MVWLLSPPSWPNPSSGDDILLVGAPSGARTAETAPVPVLSSLHRYIVGSAGKLARSPHHCALVAGDNICVCQGCAYAWNHNQVWHQFLKNFWCGGQHPAASRSDGKPVPIVWSGSGQVPAWDFLQQGLVTWGKPAGPPHQMWKSKHGLNEMGFMRPKIICSELCEVCWTQRHLSLAHLQN